MINLLFSSGTLAATLTNYEIKKVKNKIIDGNHKNHPKKQYKIKKVNQLKAKHLKIQKKNTKNKNRLLFFWEPDLSLFSLVMLLLHSSHQPSPLAIKTASTTRPLPEAPSPPDPLPET